MLPFINPMMLGGGKLRPQDVFATSLYTGNSGTQTITNGLDLAGKGGLVWTKNRVTASDPQNRHRLYDSLRGINSALSSNNINAQQNLSVFNSWNVDGFTLGGANPSASNVNGEAYVAWCIRFAKKFAVAVTYTGDGVAGRQIPHGLGDVPGMFTIKSRSSADDWRVYHRSLGVNDFLLLNDTGSRQTVTGFWGAVTNTTFTVPSASNANGVTYVAYLFAHNPDLIDCGSYVGNAADIGPAVTCGARWQPQFLLIKNADLNGSDWVIHDSAREPTNPRQTPIYANLSSAQSVGQNVDFIPTGFQPRGTSTATNGSAQKHVYLAIRSPT